MTPEVPAKTNDVLIWLVPTLTTIAGALGGWVISWWRHGREIELARAREEGREMQLAEERRRATERMFERLERVERIATGNREDLIQAGLSVPSGTQANVPNPLLKPRR